MNRLMKILIVEDNPELAQVVALNLAPHDCTIAYDAKIASETLAKVNFDLVITDINLPSGGGERILNELSVKDTPVIVFTGESPHRLKDFKLLGATTVVFKTSKIDTLLDEVEKILSASQLTD